MEIIYLISIGEVKQDLIFYLSKQIEEVSPFLVRIGKPLPYPGYAYNMKRDQYELDVILKEPQKINIEEAEKILGIVDLDFTPVN